MSGSFTGSRGDDDFGFVQLGEIEFLREGEFIGEDSFEEMIAEVFGKTWRVSQSCTIDIAPLIGTSELGVAFGREGDFHAAGIGDFEFCGEGLIALGFAEDLGKRGETGGESKSAEGAGSGGVSNDLETTDSTDEEGEDCSFHDLKSCSFWVKQAQRLRQPMQLGGSL